MTRPGDGVNHAHGANQGRADRDEDDKGHEGAVVAGADAVTGPAKNRLRKQKGQGSGVRG